MCLPASSFQMCTHLQTRDVASILTFFFLYLSLKHLKPHLSSAVCFKSLLWLLWVLHRRQQVNEGWNLWWSRSVFTPWKTLLSLLHEWTLTLCFGLRRLEIIDGSDVSSYYLLKIQTVLWTVFPLGGTGTVISPAAYLHFSFSLINVILHVDLLLTHHCVILHFLLLLQVVCLSFTQQHLCRKERCDAAAERSVGPELRSDGFRNRSLCVRLVFVQERVDCCTEAAF